MMAAYVSSRVCQCLESPPRSSRLEAERGSTSTLHATTVRTASASAIHHDFLSPSTQLQGHNCCQADFIILTKAKMKFSMLAIAGAALAAGVEGFSTARSFNVARQVSWRRDTIAVVTRTCPSDRTEPWSRERATSNARHPLRRYSFFSMGWGSGRIFLSRSLH